MRIVCGLLLIAICARAQDGAIEQYRRELAGSPEQAARTLGTISTIGPRAVPLLPEVLDLLFKSQDARVRDAAAKVVRAVGADAVPALLADPYEERAIPFLAAIGAPAVPALVDTLRENPFLPNRLTIQALAAIGAPALEPLRPLVESGNGRAAEAVGLMGKATAACLLPSLRLGSTKPPFSTGREAFAIARVRLGDPEGVELLRSHLRPPDRVSVRLLEALRDLGPAARPVADEIRACLPFVPIQAAEALWVIEQRAEPLLPHLARTLTSADWALESYRLREAVWKLVKRMGAAARPLSPILLAQVVERRFNESEWKLLESIGIDPEMTPRLMQWIQTGDNRARIWAMWAIRRMKSTPPGDPAAVIWPHLGSPHRSVRQATAWTLKHLEFSDPVAVRLLGRALSGADPKLVQTICEILAGMEGEARAAVPALRAAYRSTTDAGRRFVIWVFVLIGPDAVAAKPEILHALTRPDKELQRWAAEATDEVLTSEQAEEGRVALERILREGSPLGRYHAGQSMIDFADRDTKKRIAAGAMGILKMPGNPAETEALILLGNCGTAAKAYASVLDTRLADSDRGVRAAAAMAHYKLTRTTKTAMRVLRAMLESDNLRHRMAAAWAAGGIGADARELKPLMTALRTQNLTPGQRARLEGYLRELDK